MLKRFPTAFAVSVGLFLFSGPARAQSPATPDDPTSTEQSTAESKADPGTTTPDQATDQPPVVRKVRNYIQKNPIVQKLAAGDGFYPRLGGLNAGSGLAGGGGYRRHMAGILTDVSGAISTKVYLGVDAKVRWLETPGKTFELWTDYRYRDDTKDPFYGLGLQSPPAASTDYAIQSHDVGAQAVAHLRPWLHAGFDIGYFVPELRRGRDSRIRSIEQVFTDDTAPGLARQPKFVHQRIFVAVDTRDANGFPRRGGTYRTAYELWNDRTFNQYDFRWFEIDTSQFFAVTGTDVVALHLDLSYTNNAPGSRVPFYLLPFAGGGDTLRSFREFRFRDENAGIFNAELRHQVHALVHVAGFVDAGKVAHDWQDINPIDMKTSFGFGVRAGTAARLFLRSDVAFGGNEGPRVFVKFTPAF